MEMMIYEHYQKLLLMLDVEIMALHHSCYLLWIKIMGVGRRVCFVYKRIYHGWWLCHWGEVEVEGVCFGCLAEEFELMVGVVLLKNSRLARIRFGLSRCVAWLVASWRFYGPFVSLIIKIHVYIILVNQTNL